MRKSLFSSLRTAFFSGLFLIAPLVVTVWAVIKIIDAVGGSVRPYLLPFVPGGRLEAVWDILATIIVVLLITALGYASRYVFGKYFGGVFERLIQGIPGIGTVYNSIKQIVDTFNSQNRHIFNKVVLVEFPRKGSWTIGFLTGGTRGELVSRLPKEFYSVFIPTTPNPTSGFLVYVSKNEIIELEMSVGDGMKMLISGGAVIPAWPHAGVPATLPAGR